MTNFSSDIPSFMSEDDEYVELLWENGQVVTQGQSNRTKKSSISSTNFSPHIDRVNENNRRDGNMSKTGRLEPFESFVNEFSLPDPSGNVPLGTHDDDMVPWVNYPVEDSMPDDPFSEFLSEVSASSLHPVSARNSTLLAHRSDSVDQSGKSLHSIEHVYASKAVVNGSDTTKTRASHHYELPQQCQMPLLRSSSRVEDLPGASRDSQPVFSGDLHGIKLLKQDQASSTVGLMNFTHFTRPVVLAEASLQNVARLRSSENASTANSSKTIGSTVIQQSSGLHSGSGFLAPLGSVSTKLDFRLHPKTSKEVVWVEQSEAGRQKDKARNNYDDNMDNHNDHNCMSADRPSHQSLSFTAGLALGRPETEMGREPVVASSSACSGNSVGVISNEQKQRPNKKKVNKEEESHSEDIEDESVGLKKPVRGKHTSAKRSRAAEVHNLSERRRRDRINEKMRALQELIPNCSKVDKASLLDEAIEYLKTLQLQVQFLTQMMSMGNGLCMPPMMLPAGMQHIRMPPMAHFSQMGLGMGMGMAFGYGMGLPNMNGSTGCTKVPVPPMHGPQFRCFSPSVPGGQGMHGMPGSTTLPIFGIPGQGFPLPTHALPVNSTSSLLATANSMPEVSAAENSRATDTAPSTSSRDQKDQRINLEMTQKSSTNGFQGNQESLQNGMSIN